MANFYMANLMPSDGFAARAAIAGYGPPRADALQQHGVGALQQPHVAREQYLLRPPPASSPHPWGQQHGAPPGAPACGPSPTSGGPGPPRRLSGEYSTSSSTYNCTSTSQEIYAAPSSASTGIGSTRSFGAEFGTSTQSSARMESRARQLVGLLDARDWGGESASSVRMGGGGAGPSTTNGGGASTSNCSDEQSRSYGNHGGTMHTGGGGTKVGLSFVNVFFQSTFFEPLLLLLVARGGGKVPTDCSCKFEFDTTTRQIKPATQNQNTQFFFEPPSTGD